MTPKQQVLNKVKELLSVGNREFYNANIRFSDIEIRFTLRGKVGGKARTSPNMVLWFHPQLMERDIKAYMSIVEHEVAHLFQYRLYPTSKPHGRQFKYVARMLGNNGSRCHNMDTSGIGRPKQRYVYMCPNKCNSKYMFTTFEHRKYQEYLRTKSGRFYVCAKCESTLVWTGENVVVR